MDPTIPFWHTHARCIEDTGFQGAGYADPTRMIYQHLGFMSNLRLGPGGDRRKTYLQKQNRYVTILAGVKVRIFIRCHGTHRHT